MNSTNPARFCFTLFEDIEPVDLSAADGTSPFVVIKTSDHFKLVHGLIYALMNRNERSERALVLTTEVIQQNSANYTAWVWRRACLESLGLPARLDDELEFTLNWIKASPKNYQVWFHRRWLIDTAFSYAEAASATAQSQKNIITAEFQFIEDALSSDAKNYNCFCHRVFLVGLSAAWQTVDESIAMELKFTAELIEKDVRSNSAWSYRRQTLQKIVSKDEPLLPYDVVADEIRFGVQRLTMAPSNESVWQYIRSLNGWQAFPHVKEVAEFFAHESAEASGFHNRFALMTLLELAKYHKDAAEVERIHDLLEFKADVIRAKFWRFARAAFRSR
jgi:protein farnesyltransferase/geranylgeranyltransferase type-1 subunit alpha